MADNFEAAIAFTLAQEGGLSLDPNDPGNYAAGVLKGTKYGISAAAYPKLDIASLTEDAAKAIYFADYWTPLNCQSLPAGVDLVTLDYGVNAGVSRSVKALQAVVGVTQDGDIGPVTLYAAGKMEAATLIELLTAAHLHFYAGTEYASALMARADRARTAGLAMAGIVAASTPGA